MCIRDSGNAGNRCSNRILIDLITGLSLPDGESPEEQKDQTSEGIQNEDQRLDR